MFWLVAAAEVIAVCSAASFSVWAYRRQFREPIRLKFSVSKQLLREGVSIGLSQMFWAVKMFGATLIAGIIATSAEDVGYFAGAMRILVALHAFVWLYYFNLLPSSTRTWGAGDAAFAALIKRSLRVIAWVGVTAAVCWVLAAPWTIVTVYGQSFAPAGATLQWFAGVCVVAAISGHYRFGLDCGKSANNGDGGFGDGRGDGIDSRPAGYFKWGTAGAGAGLCVAEVMVWIGAWFYGRRMLNLRGRWKS
ncbi:MAG: hypothetical protein WKF84_23000 [Pyrinomonadaceae bacterium]